MRLNPNNTRFRIVYSETFEACFRKLEVQYPFIGEALDSVEWSLQRTPYSEGEDCPAFPGRDIRFTVTPRTPRHPAARFLFEIEDPRVILWHLDAVAA